MIKTSNRDLKGIYLGNQKVTDSFKFNSMIWKAPRIIKAGELNRLNFEWLRPFATDELLCWNFVAEGVGEDLWKELNNQTDIAMIDEKGHIESYAMVPVLQVEDDGSFTFFIVDYDKLFNTHSMHFKSTLKDDLKIKNERYWKGKE